MLGQFGEMLAPFLIVGFVIFSVGGMIYIMVAANAPLKDNKNKDFERMKAKIVSCLKITE